MYGKLQFAKWPNTNKVNQNKIQANGTNLDKILKTKHVDELMTLTHSNCILLVVHCCLRDILKPRSDQVLNPSVFRNNLELL